MTEPGPAPVLVFDASPLVAWILQTQGQWQRVQRLLDSPADCVMPAAALTETIYVARRRGNTAAPAAIHAALLAQGLRVEPITAADAEHAGALMIKSQANPATWRTRRGYAKAPCRSATR
jgi:predicted nucleic acid-binding protein